MQRKILKKIESIVEFAPYQTTCELYDADNYRRITLTANEVEQLATELRDIATILKDNKSWSSK